MCTGIGHNLKSDRGVAEMEARLESGDQWEVRKHRWHV